MSEHNCNGYFSESEDISREIQGIGIKNPQGSDFAANCRDAPIISDRDVCFPTSPQEILIITFKDRCLLCGEYLGEPYNIVYKYKEGVIGLRK